MKAFDQDLARGPWRLVPVPSFLADARAGVTFQLGWAAVLAAGVGALCVLANRLDPGLLSEASVRNIGSMSLTTLLFAVGGAATLARGGFDFTMGPVAVFAALVAIRQESPALGLAAALGFGVAIGLLVAMARVPGWILTFAAMSVLQPAALAAFPGGPLPAGDALPPWIPEGAVAVLVLASVAVFAVGQFGSRPPRGRGLGERLVDGLPYVLSAGLAGVAGIYMAHRTGGLSGGYFRQSWIETLGVVLLAGTWPGSGRPNVVATVLAALGIEALQYGLIWFNASPYVMIPLLRAVLGAGVVVSVAVHTVRARRFAVARSAPPPPVPGMPSPPPYVV